MTPLSDGWGATFDNATDSIVLSDGSPTLSFVDPATLRLRRSIQARMARAAPDGCRDAQPFRQVFRPRRHAPSECHSLKAAKACAHSKAADGRLCIVRLLTSTGFHMLPVLRPFHHMPG